MAGRFDLTLGITGASGAPYALRLLQQVLAAEKRVAVLMSDAARLVMETETEVRFAAAGPEAMRTAIAAHLGVSAEGFELFAGRDWMAPVASGSSVAPAMVVCPCSMGTLAAIAQGASDNLLERAADVTLKEGRRLILVPREAPFSAIHLENMLKLARLGVTILPAAPGFYHRPRRLEDLVDFVVARLLDQLDIPHQLGSRWGGDRE